MNRTAWIRVAAFLILAVASSGSASVLINVPANDLDDNTTENEPSIAASGSTIVIAWNNITQLASPGVSWVYYASSMNAGATWSAPGPLPTVQGGQIGGDPVLAVDSSGTFYVATLAQDGRGENFIGVSRSSATSPAVTFDPPVFIDNNVTTASPDKPWIDVDWTGGQVYLCWKDMATGSLRFTRSTSPSPPAPLTFAASVKVNTGTSPQGCSVAVGPGGEVYLAWVDGWGTTNQTIRISKSTNGGASFAPAVNVASPSRTGHLVNCGGTKKRPVLNGNVRVADNAMMAVDQSSGQYRGSVYVAYSGRPPHGSDQSDVWITRSPANPTAPNAGDPGVTWSTPVSVHKAPATTVNPDTTTNDNWFPAIAVSRATGTVIVTFYDRRNDSKNMNIDLYAARSTDGGRTWADERVTGASFGVPPLLPNFNSLTANCYMGDYNGVAAPAKDFLLTWGDNSKSVTSAAFPEGRPDPDVVYQLRQD